MVFPEFPVVKKKKKKNSVLRDRALAWFEQAASAKLILNIRIMLRRCRPLLP
jgi:hypothetical protein